MLPLIDSKYKERRNSHQQYTKISNRFLQCEPTQVAFVHIQNAAHFEIEMFVFSSESGLKIRINAKCKTLRIEALHIRLRHECT